MKTLLRVFVSWLPLAVVLSGVLAFVYIAVQQSYRMTLNDPQIQIAEDAASSIASGTAPVAIIPQERIDMTKSLAPWVAVFDASGNQIASSGYLVSGEALKMPAGLLTTDKDLNFDLSQSGEDRVTWQPQRGVRQAIVVVHTDQGYVVAGRNMREVESRESALTVIVCIAWGLLLVASFCLKYIVDLFS